jgi:hypothetical protein
VPALLQVTGAVLLVDQAAILAASIFPPAVESVQWRFGTIGLAAGRATPFLLADLLFLVGGLIGGQRGFLRFLAFVHLFLAPILIALLALFTLDTLEIRQLLPVDARRQALQSAARAGVALLAMAVFAIWAGILVLRSSPARSAIRSAERRLVVDQRIGGDA